MAKGYKTGGRKAGTPNKATATVKAALEDAFERLGGVEVLAKWAEENPGEFFKLWVKILPRDFHGTLEKRVTLEDLLSDDDEEGGPAHE